MLKLLKNVGEYIIYDMKLDLQPDKYVAAVSGGVDSVVLLEMLYRQIDRPEANLVVAHFDHGIRPNSAEDRKFVQSLAEKYGLEFFYEEGNLGSQASEALAREKRYEFLNRVKDSSGAEAIATAHHKDDVLETVIINLLRGTGRKGLSSLSSGKGIIRPLLEFTKPEIIDYAKKNNLAWREDETNLDEKYLRNYVRHSLINKLSETQKSQLLKISSESKAMNEEIDRLVTELFLDKGEISREVFAGLSHSLSAEIIAGWLRKEGLSFDKKAVERIVVGLKTARANKKIEAGKSRYFTVGKGMIRMNTPGPV